VNSQVTTVLENYGERFSFINEISRKIKEEIDKISGQIPPPLISVCVYMKNHCENLK
jgi:hypothetical protein